MYGGGTVVVGMCVCMCVAGLRVDKEEKGLGRERERLVSERDRWHFYKSADSCCRLPGRRQRKVQRRELGPSDEDRGKSLVPGQIYQLTAM